MAAVLLLYLAVLWQPVAPGVESLRVTEDGIDAELVRFELRRFRPRVLMLGAEHPRTAAALREETGAVAAVNGGFFDEAWRSLGLRIADGKVVIALRPRVDWGVLLVTADRARIIHSRDFRPDPTIDQALQVGPRLLIEGQAVHLKPQSARRTAIAVDREGRTITLIATHGAVEAQRLADLLARLGFHSALMFDGGPSSQLSAAVGQLRVDLPGAYPVPDALVVRAR